MRAMIPILIAALCCAGAAADGKLVRPKKYKGSLEEKAQEAIIIFHAGSKAGEATQDLILKISVQGGVENFAWVVPLPAEPKTGQEDAKLFSELHQYVQSRLASVRKKSKKNGGSKLEAARDLEAKPVKVLSRKIVGSYDVSIVVENEAGGLNKWLPENGYQPLENAEDVIGFYRKKGYVFACVKVAEATLNKDAPVDLHPLRFSFKPGGRDGIFFPMRLTGLQNEKFDVNLYVFYGKWINGSLSKYGYSHRGFDRRWRDYDSSECTANAGKSWSAPKTDPYLKGMAHKIPTVTKMFQKLHPGERYYLTNIYAYGLDPRQVRDWSDDLWLFPYYTDRDFVPFDARSGGVAAAAYPTSGAADAPKKRKQGWSGGSASWVIGVLVALAGVVLGIWVKNRSAC